MIGDSVVMPSLVKIDPCDNAPSSNDIKYLEEWKKEWKEVDVTAEVKDDIDAARSRSQYRLHFVTETTGGDVTGDFVYFESADNSEGTGNTPQLVVKYN